MLRPLIDADVTAYISCYKGKGDFLLTVDDLDGWLLWVLEYFPGTPTLFLTGKGNFRYQLYPEYKENRKDKVKPAQLQNVRDYLVDFWNAKIIDGMEADDAISMAVGEDTVIVSNDKDYLQLPGKIYNPTKNILFEVTEYESKYNFWKQVITGDSADAVPGLGVWGWGEKSKKPDELLTGLPQQELGEAVKQLYQKHHGDDWFSRFDLMCRLLFLKRTPTSEYYDYF